MMFKIILIVSILIFLDCTSAYQQCNIICHDDDEIVSQSPIESRPHSGRMLRGKAGSKGEKGDIGESCQCPQVDDIRQEFDSMKIRLAELERKTCKEYEIFKTNTAMPYDEAKEYCEERGGNI